MVLLDEETVGLGVLHAGSAAIKVGVQTDTRAAFVIDEHETDERRTSHERGTSERRNERRTSNERETDEPRTSDGRATNEERARVGRATNEE